jgi:hypothetical protein
VPLIEVRQSLPSILSTHGAVTSRFQIDVNAPGN